MLLSWQGTIISQKEKLSKKLGAIPGSSTEADGMLNQSGANVLSSHLFTSCSYVWLLQTTPPVLCVHDQGNSENLWLVSSGIIPCSWRSKMGCSTYCLGELRRADVCPTYDEILPQTISKGGSWDTVLGVMVLQIAKSPPQPPQGGTACQVVPKAGAPAFSHGPERTNNIPARL